MSATLKAGKCGNLTKSVTEPSRARSIRFPSAPPSSSPVGSQTSGRPECVHEEGEQRQQRERRCRPPAARRRRRGSRTRRRELRTFTRSKPAIRSRRSPCCEPAADERLGELVEPTTTTAARARGGQRGAAGGHAGSIRPTMMPPRICSDDDRHDRREVQRADPQRQARGRGSATGSAMSRRKSSTALDQREYGTARPSRR